MRRWRKPALDLTHKWATHQLRRPWKKLKDQRGLPCFTHTRGKTCYIFTIFNAPSQTQPNSHWGLKKCSRRQGSPSTLGEQGRVSHKTIVRIKAEPAWSPGRLRLPRLLRRHFLAPLKLVLGFECGAAECLHCFPCTGPGRAWSFLKETVAAGILCNTVIRGLYPFKNTSFLLVASPPTAL